MYETRSGILPLLDAGNLLTFGILALFEILRGTDKGGPLGVVAVNNQGYFLFRVHSREYMKKLEERLNLGRKCFSHQQGSDESATCTK